MLYRLSSDGRCLVTQDLARGTTSRYALPDYQRFLEECERVIDLEHLDDAVDRVISETRSFDTAIDSIAAPRIHRALPLTRREAADAAVWRYLAVIERPELIRHRWEMRSWKTMRTRFWNAGTRPDSNTFCRLWWIAELTRDADDYTLTERALSRQPLATTLFVRQLSSYRPAIEAFIDVMYDATADEIERVVLRFSAALSTVVLEGQSANELRDLLQRIRAAA